MSNTAADGGPELAQAYNYAVTSNQRSSENTDVVMDAPTMATEPAGLAAEGSLLSVVKTLSEKVDDLTQAVRGSPQVPVPPGHNFSYDVGGNRFHSTDY
jgi:hypothetical protein